MRKSKKLATMILCSALSVLVFSTSVSAYTYSYSGSFDFTCGSKCNNTLNGETSGVYRKFDDKKTATFKSTDKKSSSGNPGSGKYNVSLYNAGFWWDTYVGSFGDMSYKSGNTHSGSIYISDGGDDNYFLIFSGNTAYSYYAGTYTLTQ